jgi:hypothetical protein
VLVPARNAQQEHFRKLLPRASALIVLPDPSSPLLARLYVPNVTTARRARGKRVAAQLRATALTASPASTRMHLYRHASTARRENIKA